jgi:D-amino peptidase
MRKLYISADIEGCAGVASQHALAADRFEWQEARRWMTNEVVAAAEAALAHGFDEVLVVDGHGNGHNLLPDAMPDGVRLLRSWPRPLLQMEGIDTPDIEAAFFIGYHNGAMGTGGVLAHTYSGAAFRDLRLNGVSASEGYCNAALAGEFGVPVVLVTGDAQTAADAQAYAPAAEACIVKQSAPPPPPPSPPRARSRSACPALTSWRLTSPRACQPRCAPICLSSRRPGHALLLANSLP